MASKISHRFLRCPWWVRSHQDPVVTVNTLRFSFQEKRANRVQQEKDLIGPKLKYSTIYNARIRWYTYYAIPKQKQKLNKYKKSTWWVYEIVPLLFPVAFSFPVFFCQFFYGLCRGKNPLPHWSSWSSLGRVEELEPDAMLMACPCENLCSWIIRA